MTAKQKLKDVISLIQEKQGEQIRVFNVKKTSNLWDYFVLCNGTSSVHIRVLNDFLGSEMKKKGYELLYKDRGMDSSWIVMDFGEVLVHIFDAELRKFYSLERIWGEHEEKLETILAKSKAKKEQNG
jgi:ribosome-associated protein